MERPEVDFTPLIDVTFLLLIFFMVTANLSQPSDVKLPRASSGQGETTADKLVIHILPEDQRGEQLRLDSERSSAALRLSQLEQALSSYARLETVMICADEDVDFAYVNRVASRLRGLGVARVVLGVKEREFLKE